MPPRWGLYVYRNILAIIISSLKGLIWMVLMD